MSRSNVIALDGDGVLFNYNLGVAMLYKEVYATEAPVKNLGSYHAVNEYALENEKYPFMEHLRTFFDKRKLWSRLPAIAGAKEAIDIMVEKGYEVVCLTSMPPQFEKERLANAHLHEMKVQKVVAVDRSTAKEKGINNPKLDYVQTMQPYAFVDDLMKNFLDMSEIKEKNHTRLVYLDNKYPDDPNKEYSLDLVHEKIESLMDFAKSLPVYKEELESKAKDSKKALK